MALFEYDQGHLIPAQFGRPVAGEDQGEILDSVRAQVLEIISRPLFPVTWSDDDASPRLTALDGSGQVVSVEVVPTLTPEVLIASLARLGAVSSLGWNDLARSYPGGIGAFRSGWTQFRDSMPPHLEAGPRLVLVACEIDPLVRPALDALASSGLEVHHIAVREMSNGRRFLDVQRLAISMFTHDTNILAGRGARIGAIAMEAFTEPTAQTGAISRHCILESVQDTPALSKDPFVDSNAEIDGAASLQQPRWKYKEAQHESQQGTQQQGTQQGITQETKPEPETNTPSFDVTADATADTSSVVKEETLQTQTQTQTETETETTTEIDALPTKLEHDRLGLQTLAQVVGQDTPLVWPLQDGEKQYLINATFKLDGTIEMEGRTFTDPYEICKELGYPQQDGWTAWHLGDEHGPTLADATEEMNEELRRAAQGCNQQAHHSRH